MIERENTPSGKIEKPTHTSGTREVARAMKEQPHPGVRFDRLSMAKDKPHHGTKVR
jgi:hypothetical protein